MFFYSTINAYCEENDKSRQFCVWLRETIEKNIEPITEMATNKGHEDHYWYQIRLFYHQVSGLENGWKIGVERSQSDIEIPNIDFHLLNAASDIPDLRLYYENFVNPSKDYEYHTTPVKASMLIKFLQDPNGMGTRKVLMGHSSDGSYSSMLRTLKKYTFHFHYTGKHTKREVYGVDIVFTGYPGNLASADDFYIINGKRSKLTVAGIRIQNNNVDLWKNVDSDNTVLLSARVMAANRLAHSGRTWAKIMSRNPGFGTKQWLVLDVKRLQNQTTMALMKNETTVPIIPVTALGFEDSSHQLAATPAITDDSFLDIPPKTRNGVVWIIDQLPGRLHAEDMTQEVVYENGFWTGNGIPFFKVSFCLF